MSEYHYIAVLGATGKTGSAFVKQALAAGHKVRGVCRTPSKLETKVGTHENLDAVKGDVLDVESLTQAFEGCDVVVSMVDLSIAYGGCFDCKCNVPEWKEYAQTVAKAMKNNKIERIVFMSSWFSQSCPCDCSTGNCIWVCLVRACAGCGLWNGFQSAEDVFANSGLKYTNIRAPILGEGSEPTEDKFIYTEDKDQQGCCCNYGCSTRDRGDVARFFLENLDNFENKGVCFQ